MTKERPILMNAWSINRILGEHKTQTRRVWRKPKRHENNDVYPTRAAGRWELASGGWCIGETIRCPYGRAGDRLWVRETTWRNGGYVATDPPNIENEGKVPSIFMPRALSRITLEVVDVRVERVQDISDADVTAEGLPYRQSTDDFAIGKYPADGRFYWGFPTPAWDGGTYYVWSRDAQRAFAELWDSINADRGYSWEDNPWVWVIEFHVC